MSEVVFPCDAALMVASIDCQARYTAVLTTAWSHTGECWVGDFFQVAVPTRAGGVDAAIEAVFDRLYYRQLGPEREPFLVDMVGVDAGFAQEHVTRAIGRARARYVRRVHFHATKGVGGRGESEPWVLPSHDSKSRGSSGTRAHLTLLNVDAIKAELQDMLTLATGPRSIHVGRHVGTEFVRQLKSEAASPKYDADGVEVGTAWKLKPGHRNEGLDCMGVALGLWSLVRGAAWDRLEWRRAIENGAVEVTS